MKLDNSYFYSLTYGKTYLTVTSSDKWVDFFVNLLADRKAVDSTPKYSVCLRYKPGFYFFSLNKMQMSK